MPKLSALTPDDVVKILLQNGFKERCYQFLNKQV